MIFNLKKKEIQLEINKILKRGKPIIISGGNTIKEILNDYEIKINNTILLSDERLVNKSSKLRNESIFKNLFKKKIINPKQLINYKFQSFNQKEVNKLENKIKKINFETAILGLGSKGHFASIFKPEKIKANYYYIDNSPKYPKKRVTVSLSKISKCKNIIFIAKRNNKRNEIQNFHKFDLINSLNKKKLKLLVF